MVYPRLSIVIPIYNEAKTFRRFYQELVSAISVVDFEIILVDDGSTDNLKKILEQIKDTRLSVIHFEKRVGKDWALYRGFQIAKGKIIATLDSDMQNNPKDLLSMIELLEQDKDFIIGWRNPRNAPKSKKIISKFNNQIHDLIFKIGIHDADCPVKVFKKDCVKKIKFMKHYHRFITTLVYLQGYDIAELRIVERPRLSGKSKYGNFDRLGSIKIFVKIIYKYKQYIC